MKKHSPRFLTLVAESKKRIQEITPQILKAKIDCQDLMQLIDVREDNEWESGYIPTAIHLSKGIIERDIEKHVSNFNTPLIVYCSGGFRGALVADNLQKMGYTQVYSLDTGVQGWLDSGYFLQK